jgi:hypothetical protein
MADVLDFKPMIYFLRDDIRALFGSRFIIGLFFMFLALEAYFIVLRVSRKLLSAGEIQAII